MRPFTLLLAALLVSATGGGQPEPVAVVEPPVAAEDCVTLRSAGSRAGAAPVGVGACPGVRPGALVVTEDLNGDEWECALGFVFDGYDPQDDDRYTGRYISTAGTCALPWSGYEEWEAGEGPRAFDRDGRLIGHYVSAHSDAAIGQEFALIALLPDVATDPQMCFFGGPTGRYEGPVDGPVELRHVGQGLDDVLPGRTALATHGIGEAASHGVLGGWVPNDTGGPVTTSDGLALGTVSSGAALFSASGRVVTVIVTDLRHAATQVERNLGLRLELVTAPLIP